MYLVEDNITLIININTKELYLRLTDNIDTKNEKSLINLRRVEISFQHSEIENLKEYLIKTYIINDSFDPNNFITLTSEDTMDYVSFLNSIKEIKENTHLIDAELIEDFNRFKSNINSSFLQKK
jgi:hypothetical protein